MDFAWWPALAAIYRPVYVQNHGVPKQWAEPLAAVTFSVLAISVVVHGVSGTPLMSFCDRRKRRDV